MEIAFLFSGQGSQYPGMGRELSENSAMAKEIFTMADAIRPGTSLQCFEGSKPELNETSVTQPCMFSTDLAAAMALRENGITPSYLAGFSLGEIPALAFGGYLSFDEAFSFVCRRAQVMDRCAKENPGVMYAVLGLKSFEVEALAGKFSNCYPVNYNCETQTVVSCSEESGSDFASAVKAAGGKALKLRVSGAFHSPFMNDAAEALKAEFGKLFFNKPLYPVISNVTAEAYSNINLMFSQVNSPVLWEKTIKKLISLGVSVFIEVGPGKTLTGLMGKIAPELTALNVEDEKSLKHTLEVLSEK